MKDKKLETFNETLIIAGSNDILLANALSLFSKINREILPLYSSIGSMNGINALKKGWCHICAAHILQKEDEDYNLAYIKDVMNQEFMIVNFAYRIQGLILCAKNPKDIRGIEDVTRPDIKIVNRQAGTGTRLLLEYELEKRGIDTQIIKGYNHLCLNHLDVGIEILSGRADLGLGIQPIAQMLGLDFIPLRKERFDLIIRESLRSDLRIQTFLKFLRSREIMDYSKRFEGYDLKDAGKILYGE
jgi:molybdate-binding protein